MCSVSDVFARLCHFVVSCLFLLSRPWVVLTVDSSLSSGFSQDLLIDFSSQPDSLILLTQRSIENSPADQLQQQPTPIQIKIKQRINVQLQGNELTEFLEQQRLER